VIRQEVDRSNIRYYVVVDQAKDVIQVKVAINNPSRLKVILMHIAWFKYVKKLKRTKNIILPNLEYTCSATSGEFLILSKYDTNYKLIISYFFMLLWFLIAEKKLLDPTLIPHKLDITASSSSSSFENSPVHSILQFTSPSKYWKPAMSDSDGCYIDINLKTNHNITAVELRGLYKHRS